MVSVGTPEEAAHWLGLKEQIIVLLQGTRLLHETDSKCARFTMGKNYFVTVYVYNSLSLVYFQESMPEMSYRHE